MARQEQGGWCSQKQDWNLSVLLYLDPSSRGENQGSAKRGGKEGRYQAWPSLQNESSCEGDSHSQWLSAAVFLGNVHMFSRQGGLVHPALWLLPTGNCELERPKCSVLSSVGMYQHGFRTDRRHWESNRWQNTYISRKSSKPKWQQQQHLHDVTKNWVFIVCEKSWQIQEVNKVLSQSYFYSIKTV